MGDFDALLLADLLIIGLAAVLAWRGVLTVKAEVKRPGQLPARTRKRPSQQEKTPAEDAPGDPCAPGDDEPPF